MAINNGSLYIGDAKNTIALIEGTWKPISYFGKHKIFTNSAATFKVKNESTFFGAYSSNSAVKAKAYNDLRFQFNNLGEQIRANLATQLFSFSNSDPQWSTYTAMQNTVAVKNLSISRARDTKLNSYTFNNLQKLYITCTFNDVNFIAKIGYPTVITELSYV